MKLLSSHLSLRTIAMRIGIDIKALGNSSTGTARYLREVLKYLQEHDEHNEYILFECKLSGYSVTNKLWKKVYTPWKLPGVFWQQLVLPFLLKKYAVAVLWAPEQICPVLFVKKTKIVTTIHDCVLFHFPQTSQKTVRLVYNILFKPTIRISSKLITVSDFIRQDFLDSYYPIAKPEKTITITHGKPDWKIPADYLPKQRESFLFFAGNNEPRKNLLNLIKALEIAHDDGLTVPLHLAGPAGWKNKNLADYIRNSRISSQITFLGYCSDTELKKQYLSCKAFIYPSLYEGFGLPILEALTLDCLVATSKDTVMEEIAGKSALYFNPGNPKDIAAVIKKIYAADFDRNSCLYHKDAVLQQYSWNTSAKQILHCLEETAGM